LPVEIDIKGIGKQWQGKALSVAAQEQHDQTRQNGRMWFDDRHLYRRPASADFSFNFQFSTRAQTQTHDRRMRLKVQGEKQGECNQSEQSQTHSGGKRQRQ